MQETKNMLAFPLEETVNLAKAMHYYACKYLPCQHENTLVDTNSKSDVQEKLIPIKREFVHCDFVESLPLSKWGSSYPIANNYYLKLAIKAQRMMKDCYISQKDFFHYYSNWYNNGYVTDWMKYQMIKYGIIQL